MIIKSIIFSLIFIYPLIYVPVFTNALDIPKLALFSLLILPVIFIKSANILLSKSVNFNWFKSDLWIILFALSYIISGIFASSSFMNSFFFPGTASFVILGTVLYFFIKRLKDEDKKQIQAVLVLSAFFVSIVQIVFSAFGNDNNSLFLIIVSLPIAFYKTFKSKSLEAKLMFAVCAFVIFASAFAGVYGQLIQPAKTANLNFVSGWNIALDSIKINILGVGPGNFSEGFSRFRPITYNLSPQWDMVHNLSSNSFLTIVTEAGIISILAFLALFFESFRKINLENPIGASLVLCFIFLLLFPISASVYPLILLLISLTENPPIKFVRIESKMLLILSAIVPILIASISSFFVFKFFYAEYLLSQLTKNITTSDNAKVYQTINKVVQINPWNDRYHLAASEIYFAFAKNILQKENISDEEKKTVAGLIQQSISENKAAISVNPRKSFNWEKMGDRYLEILTAVKEADKFAIEAYNQAIFLNPINPLLRNKLGVTYYKTGNYKDSIKALDLAVLAKPDLAASHFNLALSYKANQENEKAKEHLNIALSLVSQNSSDYEVIKKEIDLLN